MCSSATWSPSSSGWMRRRRRTESDFVSTVAHMGDVVDTQLGGRLMLSFLNCCGGVEISSAISKAMACCNGLL